MIKAIKRRLLKDVYYKLHEECKKHIHSNGVRCDNCKYGNCLFDMVPGRLSFEKIDAFIESIL